MKILFLILLFTLVLSEEVQNQPTLDDIVSGYGKEYDLPGMTVALVSSDTIHYSIYSDSHNEIKLASLFQLSSNAKAITASIAMSLVKTNVLSWESRVADVVDDLGRINSAYDQVTFEDLLSHRAKIPAFEDDRSTEWKGMPKGVLSAISKVEFANYALSLEPESNPENHYYSNGGYIIAALMMEKASSKKWDELVKSYMSENSWYAFLDFPDRAKKQATAGHRFSGNKIKQVHSSDQVSLGTHFAPAGNMSMSIKDFASFIQTHLIGLQSNDQAIRTSYERMHYGIDYYSLGWSNGLIGDSNERFSYHGGGLGIYSSLALLSAERDIGIVILINAGGKRVDKVKQELRKRLWELYASKQEK